MKILTTGHRYELENFEEPGKPGQVLQFIQKELCADRDGCTGRLETIWDGTTNEELLRVLINRMNYLQTKFPCRENAVAITHFETGLLWLEKRTADRKVRGVEGEWKP